MNNEHYDEIGRTEDFSMISTMEDGELNLVFSQPQGRNNDKQTNKQFNRLQTSLALRKR